MSDDGDLRGVIADLLERAEDLYETVLDGDFDENLTDRAEQILNWIKKMDHEIEVNSDDISEEDLETTLEEYEEKLGEFEDYVNEKLMAGSVDEEEDFDFSLDDDDEGFGRDDELEDEEDFR